MILVCMNDDKRLDVAWEGMCFKDWVRVRHEKNPNIEEDCEDLENFGEEKMELILDVVLDKKPSLILIEKVKVTRYTIVPGESVTKAKILEIEEMPRTSANIAAVRAKLMEEMDTAGSSYREEMEARDHIGLWLSR
ncbi:hypothetical protein Tco_1227205 [Tanacetum coccineum]